MQQILRATTFLAMISLTGGFVASWQPSSINAVRVAAANRVGSLQAATDDSADEDAPITPEGFARIRERARLRAQGAPVKVWAESSDREVPDRDREPVPPSPEQAAAANALFESMLSSKEPDGFGEGLDNLIAEDRWA